MSSPKKPKKPRPIAGDRPSAKPRWDRDICELRFLGLLVKKYRQPAANQELLLDCFQEYDWARRIDDPLPPVAGVDAKRRLQKAIAGLNYGQVNRLIRFYGDSTGRGVCWERIFPSGV